MQLSRFGLVGQPRWHVSLHENFLSTGCHGAGRGFQTTGITFTPARRPVLSLSLFSPSPSRLWWKLMRGRSRYSLNNRIDSVTTMEIVSPNSRGHPVSSYRNFVSAGQIRFDSEWKQPWILRWFSFVPDFFLLFCRNCLRDFREIVDRCYRRRFGEQISIGCTDIFFFLCWSLKIIIVVSIDHDAICPNKRSKRQFTSSQDSLLLFVWNIRSGKF